MGFLVTSHGRTATKFLAHLINEKTNWTCRHEPAPFKREPAQKRLKQPYYGEVSAPIRWGALELRVDRGAIIIRHPKQIILSIYNRDIAKNKMTIQKELSQLNESHKKLFRLIDKRTRYKIWTFHEMVTDHKYLESCIKELGPDITLQPDDLAVRKNTYMKAYQMFEDLPQWIQDETMRQAGWVIDEMERRGLNIKEK